jgi:curved DNA-binding protein CbpA
MATATTGRSEPRDYYAVLGAEPTASAGELRAAFRDAVLRHHPDRTSSAVATRRTSVLNRAWAELRDPLRRLHYDRSLEAGRAATLDWPLDAGEAPSPRPRRARGGIPQRPSPWHQPQWRSVAGFRVPADVWLAGPAAQGRWIVEHHIAGEDWRDHRERYWLRYAIAHYRERGRSDDWVGALERLVELEPSYDAIVRADLRDAYVATREELRGASLLRSIGERYPEDSPQRRWVDREVRALLAEFRDRAVRRGRSNERAENAELLLNFIESIGIEPAFGDVRAAIMAHRRAGNAERAAELVERVAEAPVEEPARWFSLVQLLTEAGELDRASELLAAIARGDHPEALDRRQIAGQPSRRIAAARERLVRARRKAARASASPGSTAPVGEA